MATIGLVPNLEGAYLDWLSDLLEIPNSDNPKSTRYLLLEQLHRKEFEWLVPNDDNRIQDAFELRRLFQIESNSGDMSALPSMLEIVSVLALRLAFEMGEESESNGYWFEVLLGNMGLSGFTDQQYIDDHTTSHAVDNRLNEIIQRRYDANGMGGFFPLRHPREDQRCVELWFQLSAYVLERSGYI